MLVLFPSIKNKKSSKYLEVTLCKQIKSAAILFVKIKLDYTFYIL